MKRLIILLVLMVIVIISGCVGQSGLENVGMKPTTTVVKEISVSCSSCNAGNCQCTVSGCSSGYLDLYATQCNGNPIVLKGFSGSSVTWSPKSAGTYYGRILCDDETQSDCKQIIVS